jgi:hypothetical protein
MADDIRIGITVTGNNDVVTAINSTKQLESSVKKLADAYSRGGISQAKAIKGVQQLSQQYGKSESEITRYGKSIIASANEEKKAKAAATALRAEIKALTLARREATDMNRRVDADAKAAASALARETAATAALANQTEMLKGKFVDGHTAMNIYSKELNDISQAMKLGIIGADAQTAAVARLNKQMELGTGAFAGISKAATAGGRSVSRSGVLTQQAGYQMGDFLVQVQGGTNWMVAFGQQATQMVGALNYLPEKVLASSRSILGLRLSVVTLIAAGGILIPLITAIGAFWMRSREATNKAKEGISKLEEGLKSLDNTLADWVQSKKAASMGITTEELLGLGGIEAAKKNLEDVKAQLEAIQNSALVSFASMVNPIMGGVTNIGEAEQTALNNLKEAESRVNDLLYKQDQDRLALANEEIASLGRKTALAKVALQYGEESVQYKRLEETFAKAAFVAAQMEKGLKDEALRSVIAAYDTYVAMSSVDVSKPMSDAYKEAEKLSKDLGVSLEMAIKIGASDAKSGIIAAGIAASNLAKELGVAYNVLLNMQGLISRERTGIQTSADQGSPFDPRSPQFNSKDAALERARELMKTDLTASTVTSGSSGSSGGGGGGSSKASSESNYEKLLKEQALRKEMLTLSQQERTLKEEINSVTKSLGEESSKYTAAQIQSIAQVNLALTEQEKLQKQARDNMESVVNTMADSLGAGLTSMVDGTKSVKDAFKDMARAVIAELWKVFVVQKLVAGVKSLFSFADGGVFSGGTVDKKFANGGVVGGPTYFPMSGGKTGLMGEAGPEAIMPLKRGKDGKLGVATDGGGSQTVTVVQNFSFQANGDESVKRIIAQAAPSISAMAQKGMMDQRRRGGSMKSTFG